MTAAWPYTRPAASAIGACSASSAGRDRHGSRSHSQHAISRSAASQCRIRCRGDYNTITSLAAAAEDACTMTLRPSTTPAIEAYAGLESTLLSFRAVKIGTAIAPSTESTVQAFRRSRTIPRDCAPNHPSRPPRSERTSGALQIACAVTASFLRRRLGEGVRPPPLSNEPADGVGHRTLATSTRQAAESAASPAVPPFRPAADSPLPY